MGRRLAQQPEARHLPAATRGSAETHPSPQRALHHRLSGCVSLLRNCFSLPPAMTRCPVENPGWPWELPRPRDSTRRAALRQPLHRRCYLHIEYYSLSWRLSFIQNDQGLKDLFDPAEYSNIMVLSSGGYGHVALPLLKQVNVLRTLASKKRQEPERENESVAMSSSAAPLIFQPEGYFHCLPPPPPPLPPSSFSTSF